MNSMKTADRISAILLVALGIAMLWGGFVMDRLEIRHIHPASIPGLVPMGLGILSTICGGLLMVQTRSSADDEKIDWGQTDKLLWVAGLCLVFSTLLIGNIPFIVATFLFISAFAARFTWSGDAPRTDKLRKLGFAILLGLIFAGLISALFQYLFLVRLP